MLLMNTMVKSENWHWEPCVTVLCALQTRQWQSGSTLFCHQIRNSWWNYLLHILIRYFFSIYVFLFIFLVFPCLLSEIICLVKWDKFSSIRYLRLHNRRMMYHLGLTLRYQYLWHLYLLMFVIFVIHIYGCGYQTKIFAYWIF